MISDTTTNRTSITQLAECLLRQADRYSREFGIHESDGAPDEKESRPKHEPPGYQACMMRGEMWPRPQESISRPDASPPRCAQLMGLALRGCLVLVLGATAEEETSLPVRPWSAVDPYLKSTPHIQVNR